ncbi:MAG: T9SS type A sorting domain-containing protein [Bacteroidetes bacterium]|nr:T9SS type A sorting domain-containing protein [Bacteroidota bacterium]
MKPDLQKHLYLHQPLLQRSLNVLFTFLCFNFFAVQANSQGTWSSLTNTAPNPNLGGMILLSDGTVLCKTSAGGTDGIGNLYNKLTPDANGSYANGTWSSIAPMSKTRLYYASQVLKDGRVYVAGGEYGTGGSAGETYNPLTNTWANNGAIGSFVSDANSEILENGTVLQALVSGNLKITKIYDPATNLYSPGPTCVGIHNESVWVKLQDNSILFVDRGSNKSERFIPALNQWIADANVPVSLYDPYGLETGGGVLLPDGRAFFLGSLGHNAIYTPSGSTAPGSWAAAADFPNGQGTPDAPAAMMVNGKVLCAVSPVPTASNHFPSPTSYYEYDYTNNSFTRVNAPGGGLTTPVSVYETNMIDLPNGQVLFGVQGSNQYYVYTPDGSPLASGKPTITKIQKAGKGVFRFTGHLFNGISEGATYGDDWQMNSNYPIVRITVNGKVYYARTYNWNSTGVMRGNLNDTVLVAPPKGLPHGTYSVVVVANGISSNPYSFSFAPADDQGNGDMIIADNKLSSSINKVSVYPNPAPSHTTLEYNLAKTGYVNISLVDAKGNTIKDLKKGTMQQGYHTLPVSTSGLSKGMYFINMVTDNGVLTTKLVVQ